MLAAIEASIQRLIPHDVCSHCDFMTSTVPISCKCDNSLQERTQAPTQEAMLPIDGTPEGWIFVNQELLLMSQIGDKKGRSTRPINLRLESNRVAGFL